MKKTKLFCFLDINLQLAWLSLIPCCNTYQNLVKKNILFTFSNKCAPKIATDVLPQPWGMFIVHNVM